MIGLPGFPDDHDPRPFVMGIPFECWFDQRSSASLWPHGSVLGSQREKANAGQTEEDFGEAMHALDMGPETV